MPLSACVMIELENTFFLDKGRRVAVMAKTSQTGSASQRRAQERQQRQHKEDVRVSALNKGKAAGKGRGPRVRKKDRTGLYMGIGVSTLLVAIIVAFIIIRNQPLPPRRAPADPTVVQQLTTV